MSDDAPTRTQDDDDATTSFEQLIESVVPHAVPSARFTTAFRGYDKDEVDAAVAELTAQVREQGAQIAALAEQGRSADRSSAETAASIEQMSADLAEAKAEAATLRTQAGKTLKRLQAELSAAEARAKTAEQRIDTLAEEIAGSDEEAPGRHQFEEVLRVAEDQASVLVRNASVQGERLLEAARIEVENRRKESLAEGAAIRAEAQHDAQQVRLRIDTELTAHEATIARESAHAAEKVAQAEQEAAAVRSEADKGAAALRSTVARETTLARSEAEDAVKELRMRALEFESSLTRRQDDAQQEFLVLHNRAVAHAERITQDANDQVAASLDHAQRIAAKADDFERLMRAQSQQIEADAHLRSREKLEQARIKAQKIVETVTTLSQAALRDAEDRTRDLRWQQQQLMSFMAEVKELIRPDAPVTPEEPTDETDEVEEVEETEVVGSGDEPRTADVPD